MKKELFRSSQKLLNTHQIAFRTSITQQKQSIQINKNKKQQIHQLSNINDEDIDLIDCKNKGYQIMRQLSKSEYKFTKKGLISYLKGKPVNSQQLSTLIKPPINLKGYMYFNQEQHIENLIQKMLQLQILKQDLVFIQSKRQAKRILVGKDYEWNSFPQLMIPFIEINQINNQNKKKQQSRLSNFLIKKNQLPTNIQKKQYDQIHKRKIQEQKLIKLKLQHQKIKRIEKQQEQRKQIQRNQKFGKLQQKQQSFKKMNSFWEKQRQKISDILPLNKKNKNTEVKQKINCSKYINSYTKDNALKSTLQQIKQKENEKKKQKEPIVTWDLIKSIIQSYWERQNKKQQKIVKSIHKKKQSQEEKQWKDIFQIKKNKNNNKQKKQKHQERSYDNVQSTQASVTKTNFRLITFQKQGKQSKQCLNKNHAKQEKKQYLSSFKRTKNIKQSQQSMFNSPYYGHLSLYSSQSGLKQLKSQFQSQSIKSKQLLPIQDSTITLSIPTKVKATNSKQNLYRSKQLLNPQQYSNSSLLCEQTVTLIRKKQYKFPKQSQEIFTFTLENNKFQTICIPEQTSQTVTLVNNNNNKNKNECYNSQQQIFNQDVTLTMNIYENFITKQNSKQNNKQEQLKQYANIFKPTKKHKKQSESFIDQLIELEVSRPIVNKKYNIIK